MKTKIIILALLLSIRFAGHASAQTLYTVSGYVYDVGTNEPVVGAVISCPDQKKGSTTNLDGFYSLTMPVGNITIVYKYLGYKDLKLNLRLDKNITNTVRLKPVEMTEVVVHANNDLKDQVKSTQMSQIKVQMDDIKRLPSLGGEVDIIKVLQLMPGIKRGSEGQTGMYVRGGGVDQNLILLDEATVYNIGHLFGFFSVFNDDALKSATIIKGGFPSNYGGRISSILDMRMKEGNMQKFEAEGGIGMLSSRLTLQGPIIKNKLSLLVSARRSYIDQVFSLAGYTIPYYFYDFNAKINYNIGPNDRISYSGYYGNDVLAMPKPKDSATNINPGFGFKLGNFTNSLHWSHVINPHLYSDLSFVYTQFQYDITGKILNNSLFIGSKIRDASIKYDFNFTKDPLNHYKFGATVINHTFNPNIISVTGEISQLLHNQEAPSLINQEFGGYAMDDRNITEKLTLNYGFRLSGLLTSQKIYIGPEPRLSATYSLSENSSIKASYSRMYQYMHLVSSSSLALPTDLWYPVTPNIKPQNADQVAVGYTHFFESLKTLVTLEAYDKWMRNLIEYKEGSVLALNNNYEKLLLQGNGNAYGFEFFINKTAGRFNGWIGYSLSWANRQFDGLNNGNTYPAKYDRRHDLSVVANFDISKRITFSAVWVYSSGERFTGRIDQFVMPNPGLNSVALLPVYTDKNAIELTGQNRIDVNLVIKRKPGRKWQGEWCIGAYNILNKTQPYTVRIVSDGAGALKYQQVGLFGLIPSIAYNFKF